jgi:CelD/BcsL family acetyltransferase involved in cellulose biosynthesis
MTVLTDITGSTELLTLTSFEDCEALAPEWDELVEQVDASLYMTFGWGRVWWRHYGAGRELRITVVRRHGELVGVLPFFIERSGVPLARARVAKLVGSDFTLVDVDPPLRPEVASEALAEALRRLFEDDRCDLVHLGPISGVTRLAADARSAVAELDDVAQIVRDREAGSHTLFRMPDGFDAYLQGLSKNQRSNYRRNVNKLKKTFDFEVDVVRDGPQLESEFEAFVAMHQAQWATVNKLGHYGDWPGSHEFALDMLRTLAREDRVRLIRLIADGQVVSYYFCFELHGTYYWRLPARLTGETWDRFALGRVGLLKMLEVASAEGATTIEAGTGRYEYKEQLNAETFAVHSLAVGRRGLTARARARLALALGDLLNLAYYRGWYLWLAPRLRVSRRPLWRSWIRHRF